MSLPSLHFGTIAHLRGNPFSHSGALEIIPAGALWIDAAGRIAACGERAAVRLAAGAAVTVHDHGDAWLLPGFIDGHLHFPQYYATAAYGGQLLDWLVQSVFPAELAYADADFARHSAMQLVQHLLACGTTTALVFGSQFAAATDSLFDAAERFGLRLIAGPTLMDLPGPQVPDALLHSVEHAHAHSEALIARCQSQPLLHYALTPRYALSCSPALLELCADLLHRHPDIYLQTHINENHAEIAAVAAHYPDCRDYLAVYERFGLIGARTVLAHNIHATDAELARIAQADCAVCHCPASNLYLGSGLFPLAAHLKHGIRVGVGTDIGAGSPFSVWRNLADAYSIQQLQGHSVNAAQLLYLGTLGGANMLRLEHETGNFARGKSADFCVLDLNGAKGAHAYLRQRLHRCASSEQQLFCLLHLADAAHISATFVGGQRRYPTQENA